MANYRINLIVSAVCYSASAIGYGLAGAHEEVLTPFMFLFGALVVGLVARDVVVAVRASGGFSKCDERGWSEDRESDVGTNRESAVAAG